MAIRKAQTSILEQAIYHYVQQLYPDAVNRYVFLGPDKKKYEADVYVPSVAVAIEYDGEFWHRDKGEHDLEKNTFFLRKSIFLIRVRDWGLPELKSENGITLFHQINGSDGLHTYEIITEIMHELAEHTSDAETRVKAQSFSLSYEHYYEERSMILAKMFCAPCEDNITKSCIYKCWDAEKNQGLVPENIPINTTTTFWFSCPDGHSFVTAPSRWKNQKCDKNCSVCAYFLCPFLSVCPPYELYKTFGDKKFPCITETCQFIKQYIYDYVEGKKEWPSKYGSQLHMMLSYTDSGLDLELLRLYCDSSTSSEAKQRILYAFCNVDDLTEGTGYAFRPANIRDVKLKLFNAKTIEDLDLCKRIIEELDWSIVIKFSNFQDGAEKQTAAVELFDWIVKRWKSDSMKLTIYLGLVRLPYSSGYLNEGFKAQLRQVLIDNKIEFRLPIFK